MSTEAKHDLLDHRIEAIVCFEYGLFNRSNKSGTTALVRWLQDDASRAKEEATSSCIKRF